MKPQGIASALALLALGGVSASPVASPDVGTQASSTAPTWDANHEANHSDFSMLAAAPSGGGAIVRTSWTVTCDSEHAGNECAKAIDSSTTTFWHTDYTTTSNASLPHSITIDMGSTQNINGISSLPRQDGSTHGFIAQHSIYVSTDGKTWGSPVALGNWYYDNTKKYSNFEPVAARYVRVTALSEATGAPWTSIADLNVYKSATAPATAQGIGKWGLTLDFPVVPVAGAVEPTSGKVLVWSAYKDDQFTNSPGGYTLTSEYDPATGMIDNRKIQNTGHDMFCPGISIDGYGDIVVTGGDNADRTSLFDTTKDAWISGPNMNVPRGYQASATCSDGRVFTIGGSWSGGQSEKDGEIWSPVTKKWTMLPDALVKPMLTNDPQGLFRADNHAWLFGWKSGYLFQAGPSTAMNWYSTTGTGSVKAAGQRKSSRGVDPDSMCGNAVMFDAVAGKILTVGGSTAYQDADSTAHAHLITIGTPGDAPTVTFASNGMYYARIFANSVVLPNGNVFITGGQAYGAPFDDTTPVLTPEMYNPTLGKFYKQASNSIVRVYHSMALLLPDGTIFSGGGGLCGTCDTNHFDAQIFTPQYLLNSDGSAATRPVIKTFNSARMNPGATLTFTTDSAIKTASLVRYGSATHALNTDQRRVPLTIKSTGTNSYSAVLPSDSGILLPGWWMLFVMNANGVPSVASTIKVILPS